MPFVSSWFCRYSVKKDPSSVFSSCRTPSLRLKSSWSGSPLRWKTAITPLWMLFQVALAQARRCCVPRSSAAAAAGSLLPRSLRLGELMNFNLRRVLMVTPIAGSAPTRALRHAAPPAPAGAAPSTKIGRAHV